MKKITLLLLFVSTAVFAQKPIGLFAEHADIGYPALAGSSSYDKATSTYSIKGGGANIWFSKDQFQFLFKKIKGDFTLTGDFAFVGKGKNGHRKVGWMIRAAADSNAVHYSAVIHGDGLTVLQWRPVAGAKMLDPENEIFAKEKNYLTVQLQRTGNKITMRAAPAGKPLIEIGSTEMQNMPPEAMAGMFICAHDGTVVEEAKVSNVKLTAGPQN